MKEKLLTLLNNATNVETRKQFLIAYLTLIDSVEQQAEDLATVISGLLTAIDAYKDIISDLAKNQKEANSEEKLCDEMTSEELYDGMTRRGDDGNWEKYCASDGEWYVPMHQWYDEENEEWRNIRELDSEELDDYE